MIFPWTYNKPVLLAGSGVRSANASGLLYEFAHKTNIPVITSMNAVDLAQDDIHIGFFGTHGNRVANMILNHCDLVVSVGSRLGIRQAGKDTSRFAPKADLVRVDIDEYELSRNIKENEKKYPMDAGEFLKKVLGEDIKDYSQWKKQCVEAKELLKGHDIQPGNRVVMAISEILPENPIVCVDVGMNQCWAAQSLQLRGRKGRIHIAGGYGSMGCALPYAIGSSAYTNKGRVYCISGDGGMQMNIQELETVRRENLPIKIFVLNNKVLGKISETQELEHDKRFMATTKDGGYSVPDFVKIAQAYGIRAISLESYDKLDEYRGWLGDNLPCLIEIKLPEDSYLTPKIEFDSGQIRPQLNEEIMQKVSIVLEKI